MQSDEKKEANRLGRPHHAADRPGISRRTVLRGLTATALAGFNRISFARKDTYPTKPILVIQGFAPGGPTDLIARFIAGPFLGLMKQPLVVEARPGANGTIAAEQVAKAAPDGYTLGLFPFNLAMAPAFMKNIPYDTMNDFTPIGQMAEYPFVLVVPPTHSAKSFDDFIRNAKANPGKVTMATAGLGSGPHLGAAQLAHMAGISFLYIPYTGSAQTQLALLRGEVDGSLLSVPLAVPDIAAGKMRGLATTGLTRAPELPDLPTIRELGYKDYDLIAWMALMGPRGLPAPITQRLEAALQATMSNRDVQNNIHKIGFSVAVLDARECKAKLQSDVKHWAEVARQAGITPE